MKKGTKTKKRYERTKHVGVRYDTYTGRFEAYKTIKQKRHSEYFDNVRKAIHWRNTFIPEKDTSVDSLDSSSFTAQNPWELLNQNALKQMQMQMMNPALMAMMSGKQVEQKTQMVLGEALDQYVENHIMKLGHSSRQTKVSVVPFAKDLYQVPMDMLNPNVICQHILKQKMFAESNPKSKRYSFDTELKTLKAFFNWYREKIDYTFVNPVLKSHFKDGRIKEKLELKDKKLSPSEIRKLFKAFKKLDKLWYQFALVHFYFAGRAQEPAGLQDYSVNFDSGFVEIKDVAIWDRVSNDFVELKRMPKNGETRECFMSDELRAIFKERIENLPKGCHFVFHIKGRLLRYREIQYAYERALRSAGLDGKGENGPKLIICFRLS